MICLKRLVVCMDDLCYGGTTLCGFDSGLQPCRNCRQLMPEEDMNAFGICVDCREEEPDDCEEEL
jgi:hypothetical protein